MKGLHTQKAKPDQGGSGSSRQNNVQLQKRTSLKQELNLNLNRCHKRMTFRYIFFTGWISPSPTLSQNTEDACFKKITRMHPLCISATANPSNSALQECRTLLRMHHADRSWATIPALKSDTKTRNLVPTANQKHQKQMVLEPDLSRLSLASVAKKTPPNMDFSTGTWTQKIPGLENFTFPVLNTEYKIGAK